MAKGERQEGDEDIQFLIGTTEDGRVFVDYRRFVDHIKLDVDQAFAMAEGLVEAGKQAVAGRHIITNSHQNKG